MSKIVIDSRRSSGGAHASNDGIEASEVPWLALVAEKVKTLNYGVVQIVVHDSRVVQVERTERHRFDVPRAS